MKSRKLGASGPEISALGLGCMGMSDFYGPRDEAESIATLHRALALGVTHWDTADMYGPHTNEELLGRALKGIRDQVFLATKFGVVRNVQDKSFRGFNGRPEYVRASIEGSLQRLGVDHVDLYYLHRRDPNTAIEDTVSAMAELVQAGKVRYLGLSEVSPETLVKAHRVHPITAVQSEYSLWSREPEVAMLQQCEKLGVGFVPYSPLGRGFLSGAFKSPNDFASDDFRRHSPRFQGGNFERNLQLVKHIEDMANRKGCTPSQLALAWVLAQGEHICPIFGTKRVTYLEENVEAINISLTDKEVQEIDAIFPMDVAAGTRYPEERMGILNG